MSPPALAAGLGDERRARRTGARPSPAFHFSLFALFTAFAEGDQLPNYLLKLYVTGNSPRTEAAIANLRRICEEELAEKYELQVIDVNEHPQVAEDDRILATPTLIKQLPPPLRRVIGDLSDKGKVLLGLELRPKNPSS